MKLPLTGWLPEIGFVVIILSLLSLSSYMGAFDPAIELPNRVHDVEKNWNKFWVDYEMIALSDKLGLKGASAFIVQSRTFVRSSVIAFPNGFVQQRYSREENMKTLEEIKAGVDRARAGK